MEQMQQIAAWIEPWIGGPVDWKQIILIGLSPVFLLAVGVEWILMRKRSGQDANFRPKDILTNLHLGASYQVFELIVHALLLMAVMHWVYNHRIFHVPFNAWTAVPLFILTDLS